MLDRILIGSSAEPTDTNFKNVTLLLHGDGSNGAQNNTFIDSSTNNFTITRNGNTTQGSFSPYGSNWSNYFDGTGDWFSVPSNAALEMGSSDFTYECWVYPTEIPNAYQSFIEKRSSTGSGYAGVLLAIKSNGKFSILVASGSSTWGIVDETSVDATLNTWQHLAVVRSGSTFSVYLNGVRKINTTISFSVYDDGSVQGIGAGNSAGAQPFYGYISNVRIVKGTAVYSGASFTPPTSPLTAITNTSLLTCADNRFRDGSTNNFTITRNGDVKVTNFAPFAPSSAYSTTTNGGSAYFDGTDDYLNTASSSAAALTGDWTVETWVYPTSFSANGFFNCRSGGQGCALYSSLTGFTGGPGAVGYATNSALVAVSNITIPLFAWTHIAFTRSGNTVTCYINGVSNFTYTETRTFASSTSYETSGSGSTHPPMGYFAGYRVVNGSVVYTSNFTPPTSPPTAVTNTNFLMNFTNAAIFDNSMKNDLETGNSAQISTSVKKFGSGSMYFPNNGSCDFLVMSQSPIYAMPGDFTVEFWLYPTLVDANDHCIYDTRASASDSGAVFFLADTGKIRIFAHGNIRYTSTTALAANTWSHVAIVRQNGTISSYINGTKDATTASFSSALTANSVVYVARRMDDANTNGVGTYRGYIDEMRVTPGVARYTASFTAPTAPFPNK